MQNANGAITLKPNSRDTRENDMKRLGYVYDIKCYENNSFIYICNRHFIRNWHLFKVDLCVPISWEKILF